MARRPLRPGDPRERGVVVSGAAHVRSHGAAVARWIAGCMEHGGRLLSGRPPPGLCVRVRRDAVADPPPATASASWSFSRCRLPSCPVNSPKGGYRRRRSSRLSGSCRSSPSGSGSRSSSSPPRLRCCSDGSPKAGTRSPVTPIFSTPRATSAACWRCWRYPLDRRALVACPGTEPVVGLGLSGAGDAGRRLCSGYLADGDVNAC